MSTRSTRRGDLNINHRRLLQFDFDSVTPPRKVELAGLDHIIVVLLDGVRIVAVWSCALRQGDDPTNQFAHAINSAGLEWGNCWLLGCEKGSSSQQDNRRQEAGKNEVFSKAHARHYS